MKKFYPILGKLQMINNQDIIESLRDDGLQVVIEYYQNGNIKREKWFKNNKNHRDEDLPARIDYFQNGNIHLELFYKNGLLDREVGPASILYYQNGNVNAEEYYRNNLQFRKGDLPCIILYYPDGKKSSERWANDRFGYNTLDFKPKPNYIFYHQHENKILQTFWYKDKQIPVNRYISINYLLRRFILKFKAKKRKEMFQILKSCKGLYYTNGPDICKLITKYIF